MLRALLQHFLPFDGTSFYSTLSAIDRNLNDPRLPVPDVLMRARSPLCELMRNRFTLAEAQALTLKILNIFLARHEFANRIATPGPRPIGLVVDPSNLCALACPGCVHSHRSGELRRFDWPAGTLAEAPFARLLELYGPTAIGVYFCNYGEPLLNRHTPNLIRAAKRYLLTTALSTSLSVGRFDPDAYVESGLDFMVLSIDGVTPAVYNRFRRNGNLDLVLDNLRRLVEAKRRLRRTTPVLSWNFLAFEHNAHEIPLAARMAVDIGVNLFRVVRPFDVTWDDPDIRPAAVPAGVQRLDLASIANLPDNWNPFPGELETAAIAKAFEAPPNRDEPAPIERECHWLYKNLVMDAQGRILPCCGAPTPFTTIDHADPFHSPRHSEARTGAPTKPCEGCEWDHSTVNIGPPEIRRYFRAADPAFFNRRTLTLLSDWPQATN